MSPITKLAYLDKAVFQSMNQLAYPEAAVEFYETCSVNSRGQLIAFYLNDVRQEKSTRFDSEHEIIQINRFFLVRSSSELDNL